MHPVARHRHDRHDGAGAASASSALPDADWRVTVPFALDEALLASAKDALDAFAAACPLESAPPVPSARALPAAPRRWAMAAARRRRALRREVGGGGGVCPADTGRADENDSPT